MLRSAVAVVLVAGGLGVAATPGASASAAAAAAGTTFYVDPTAQSCSDSGSGSLAAPFCTVQAGANAATAGDTVAVAAAVEGVSEPSENVTVPHSGTDAAPITFEPYNGPYFGGGGGLTFVLNSVSDIVIRGYEGGGYIPFSISNSTGIDIQDSVVWTDVDKAVGVKVTGASSVTVERSQLGGTTPSSQAVYLGPGSVGVVRDDIFPQTGFGIVADGTAPGTAIVANTIDEACGPAIKVTDSSGHVDIENNVVENLFKTAGGRIECTLGGIPRGIAVDAGATSGVTEQYNTVANDKGMTVPYVWGGVDYKTLSAYQAASGQGVADDVESTIDFGFTNPSTDPGVIGVANPAAADQPGVDYYGQSPVGTVPDRGAIQYQTPTTQALEITGAQTQTIEAALDLHGIPWGTSLHVSFDWGDGTVPTVPIELLADPFWDYRGFYRSPHTYQHTGTYTVTATLSDGAGTFTQTQTVTTGGSTYVPVNPSRVLDTRAGTGAPKAAVGAGGTVTLSAISGVDGAPAAGSVTAVVVNVTVTSPANVGYVTVYPAGHARPGSSNLNFTRGQTVANLVTVRVGANGKIAFYNGSGGTAQLIADIEGYYVAGPAGAGYTPVTPQRLLDTRAGTGAPKQAVAAKGKVTLTVAGVTPVPPSGVTAVALNVTETSATGGGNLTVWPDGTAVPNASNLNFAAGQTVPNLVIVAVPADGKIDLANTSNGTVQLIADVEGYYTSGGGDAFVPLNPVRELDTRTGLGLSTTVDPHQVAYWNDSTQAFQYYAAAVVNVTVTDAAAVGFIAAYPGAATTPNASNLNFSTGQTVANLVMVGTSPGPRGDVNLYNGSNGTVDLVGDLAGYFS